jgi:hypothetical protein
LNFELLVIFHQQVLDGQLGVRALIKIRWYLGRVFAEFSSTWLYTDEIEWNMLDTTCGAETIFGAISILIEYGAIYND